MSRNHWLHRWTKRGCAVVGLGLIAVSVSAGPPERPSAVTSRDDGLMTSHDAQSAPFSVRLKITGFLARQHAREGDSTRALREFHSMLSVDDPAWPDNEEGDAMRIARDLEVARMMTESGFYDHSIRVLESARVLAETNDDPQSHLVDRQIESTAELAQLKGQPLPAMGPMELNISARPLPRTSRAVVEEEDEPIEQPARRTAPPTLALRANAANPVARVQNADRIEIPLPDLPPASPKRMTPTPAVEPTKSKVTVQTVAEPAPLRQEEKSLVSRIIPSRWRDKEDGTQPGLQSQTSFEQTPAAPPAAGNAQRRPMISPDVSPHYCPECAAHANLTARRVSAPPPALSTKSVVGQPQPIVTANRQPVVQPEPAAEPATTQIDAATEKSAVRVASAQRQNTKMETPAVDATANAAIDAGEKPKRGVLNKLAARRAAQAPNGKQNPLFTPPVVIESDESASKPADESKPQIEAGPALKLTGLDAKKRDAKKVDSTAVQTDSDKGAAQKSNGEIGATSADKPTTDRYESTLKSELMPNSDTLSLTEEKVSAEETREVPADKTAPQSKFETEEKSDESVQLTPTERSRGGAMPATAARTVRNQVGIAGLVAKPGIFTVDGNSTTLATLLRRAGSGSTAQHARVLRAVELGRSSNVDAAHKDFYLQRVEISRADAKLLATPIYGQEIVIVDGDGQRPIYIAIMPHFILQLPVVADRPTTADQIVEQLRVYWPNIRNQEIGVLRYEESGSAAKIDQGQDDNASLDKPLKGGDVLYVDGMGLDERQVIAAAEAVARLVGAKVRQAQ